jgi:hypothetical protein
MEMLFYFGKSLIVSVAFYAVYMLVLKRLTFFTLNRGFLLLALLTAAIAPALHFTTYANIPLIVEHQPVGRVAVGVLDNTTNGVNLPLAVRVSRALNYTEVLHMAYWLVTVLLAIRLLILVSKLVVTAYRYSHKQGRLYIINNQRGFNFSFFNLVFLDGTGLTAAERRQVFAHEAWHCRLGHSADNVLMGVMKVLFWFNPVVYLLSRKLRLIHELQVDNALTGRVLPADGYVTLLLKIASRPSGSLVNTFGSGSLKGRVQMLMQRRSAGGKRLIYPAMLLLLAPLCLCLTGQKVLPYPVQGALHNEPFLKEVLTVIVPKAKPVTLITPAVRHKAPVKTQQVSTNFKLTITSPLPQDSTKLKMLASDSVFNDKATSTIHMHGHAVAQIGNTLIRANYIRINLKEKKLFASKVSLEDVENPDDKMVITGDSLRYDLKTNRAFSYQRSLY